MPLTPHPTIEGLFLETDTFITSDDLPEGLFTYNPRWITPDLDGSGLFFEGDGGTPVIPVPSRTTEEVLSGDRVTVYGFELLNLAGDSLGLLDGVTGGNVRWVYNGSVKGTGSLEWVRPDETVSLDWRTVMVRITAVIRAADGGAGEVSWGCGVWVPSVPRNTFNGDRLSASIDIMSREVRLQRSPVLEAYSIPAGTVVTDAIRDLIEDAGEPTGAITDMSEVTPSDKVWPAGTSRLEIINDLCAMVGYFSLFTDGNGQYRVQPNDGPDARPVSWRFEQGPYAIHVPSFTQEQDLYAIPNVLVAKATGTGATEGLVSVATNDDPDDPLSTVNRGLVGPVDGVYETEAATQEILDAAAQRRLNELSGVNSTLSVAHAPIPELRENQVVWAANAATDAAHFVVDTALSFDPKALATSTIREVRS